jgi:hypothetical protein
MKSGMTKRIYIDGLIVLQLPNNGIKVCYPDGKQAFLTEED